MKTYPLLQSQLGVFTEWMADPSITRYNLPAVVRFSKKVIPEKIIKALETIIAKREVLRTRFVLDDEGLPMQYSDPDMVIPIQQKSMTEGELEEYLKNDFIRPYDLLSGDPLCRMEVVETPQANYVLFEVHHTIADGLTLGNCITLRDFPTAYKGEALEEIPYGMYQYAEDEQATLHSDAYERSKQYYAEKYANMEFTTISTSAANPLGNSIHEDSYLSQEAVDNWCQQNGTSSNLLFMAAFSYVLSEASREEQVVYRTINHGRMDKRLMNSYGMFVKSAPILANVDRSQSVIDFIKGFRRELMSIVRYGNYPFNHFCRDLKMSGGV